MKPGCHLRQERYEPGAVEGVEPHPTHDFAGGGHCLDCGCTRGMPLAERKCVLGAKARSSAERDKRRCRAKRAATAARAEGSGR
jgi:hypothetical protein